MPPYCRNCGTDLPGNPRRCFACGLDRDVGESEQPGEQALTTIRASSGSLYIYPDALEVVSKTSLFQQARSRIRYEQVAQVAVRNAFLASSIIVESYGGGRAVLSGLSPSQAEEARIVIQEQVNRAASSSGASPSSPTHDVPALIRNLAELKEAGIISEAEFEAKKKDLLDRM